MRRGRRQALRACSIFASLLVAAGSAPSALASVEAGSVMGTAAGAREEAVLGEPRPRAGLGQSLRLERLDWTLLAAGATVFLGSAATLTALDARSMERDLQGRLEAALQSPQPGAEIRGLQDRTERRALLANIFFGAAGAGLLVTAGLYYMEAWAEPGSEDAGQARLLLPVPAAALDRHGGAGLLLTWRIP